MKLRLSTLAASAALCFTAGCAVGPDFKTPDAPQAQTYGAQAPQTTVSTNVPGGEAQSFVNKPVPSQWWKQFGSDKLDQLVEQAFAGSPDLAAAQAALRQANENYRASRSGMFPAVDGALGATRQKIDTSSFGNPAGGSAIYDLFNASVNVSYGLDLFGGTRRGIEQQAALNEAQRFQYEGAYQALAANVVTAAVQEAQLRALISGKKAIIDDVTRQLDIVRKQFDLGAVGNAEVLSARSNLATEQADLPALELQLSRIQNQLAIYLGKAPSERVATDFNLTDFKLPQEVPVSLPSDLVRQRPDVRAAEAQLHAAYAGVGVAVANQLPQIALSASYGTQSAQASKLFEHDIWSIGANLTQPIFRAGQLGAQRRAAEAARDQAAAQYRGVVLQSFQNVSDSLRALEADAQVLHAQYDAADAAQASLDLTEKQFKLGGASYVDLLAAQRQNTLAKTGLVQALASRYADTAALFLALGGGWQDGDAPQTTAEAAPAPAAEPAATPAEAPATAQP